MRILSKNSFNCSLILILVPVCEICLFSPKSLKTLLQEHEDICHLKLDCSILGNIWWLLLIALWVFLSKAQVYKKQGTVKLSSLTQYFRHFISGHSVLLQETMFTLPIIIFHSQLHTTAIKWIKMTASPCPSFQDWCILCLS